MRSLLSCLGIFCFEIAYILLFYDPHSPHRQGGLMLIFIFEMSFFLEISRSNVEEKRRLGKVSARSRAYTAPLCIAVLGMLALGSGTIHLEHDLPIWVGLFIASACAKVAWIWGKARTSAII